MQFKLKDITFAKIVKALVDTKQFEVLDDFIKSKNSTEKPAPKKAEDKEQLDRLHEALKQPTKPEKPLPIQLARAYLKEHPKATKKDVLDYLIKEHVNPGTAKSTSHRVFKAKA